MAQSRRLAGQVVDGEGRPVIGAGIVCREHPETGTVTDLEGRFSLSLPAGARTVVISAIGMKSLVHDLADSTAEEVRLVLREEENRLDQAVVTGYAQTTLKKITGSVGILKADRLEAGPVSSVSALLQGEVAGVQVSAVSGQPGTTSRISIRGINSLSGTGEPLWVVDGVPLQDDLPRLTRQELATGGFDPIFVHGIGRLNPNDIAQITILKDAAAAAIYGSRAANGVIVLSTKHGEEGRMRMNYHNDFTWSFRPQRSPDLMNAAEKIAWEDRLWERYAAERFARSRTDPTVVYPVVGLVGQIRSGAGEFAALRGDKAAQDALLAGLAGESTDWYRLLLRNAFSHHHHLSLSGGTRGCTYYVSGGVNHDDGMLIHNIYRRYSLSGSLRLRPAERLTLDLGFEGARQQSRKPESAVNAFEYACFANPYERPYRADGSYAPDRTWFSLGVWNGRGQETVLPKDGFNLLRELDKNRTATVHTSATVRGRLDLRLTETLGFTGLASWSHSDNATDQIIDKDTWSAFQDRLGNDNRSQTKLYGHISQNRTGRESFVARGQLSWLRNFGTHKFNVLAGGELRGSGSNTVFSRRYHYDPVTGTSSLPIPSGPADQWLSEVERLSGQYFTKNRYASFYASADWFIGRTFVLNASLRSDGSSNFGNNRQFNPTWSAGAAWHFSEEKRARNLPALSHGTLRLACGYTGEVNTSATHRLVMKYRSQEYRHYGEETYPLGYIPAAPNPDLGWEKTADGKIGLDFGLWKDRLCLQTEVYCRNSTSVVCSSRVPSTTGFTYVHFNSADILNSGVEATVDGRILRKDGWTLSAAWNFTWNYNKVTRYRPAGQMGITAKDRYIEGYPIGAIVAGKYCGIDPRTGLYQFRLREDARISKASDLNRPDNYRYYLGTGVAPYFGGIHFALSYKLLRLSVSGVYSFGSKVRDKIESPASRLLTRHAGITPEEVQSQYSDLYSNHLNVNRDRTDCWTPDRTDGVKYPRIYDCYDPKYNFAASHPMDWNIIDAIYLKDCSYLRLKTVLLTLSLPEGRIRKIGVRALRIHLSLNNLLTFTGYDGMDPEIPGATYPTTRSLSAGIDLEF